MYQPFSSHLTGCFTGKATQISQGCEFRVRMTSPPVDCGETRTPRVCVTVSSCLPLEERCLLVLGFVNISYSLKMHASLFSQGKR